MLQHNPASLPHATESGCRVIWLIVAFLAETLADWRNAALQNEGDIDDTLSPNCEVMHIHIHIYYIILVYKFMCAKTIWGVVAVWWASAFAFNLKMQHWISSCHLRLNKYLPHHIRYFFPISPFNAALFVYICTYVRRVVYYIFCLLARPSSIRRIHFVAKCSRNASNRKMGVIISNLQLFQKDENLYDEVNAFLWMMQYLFDCEFSYANPLRRREIVWHISGSELKMS